MVMMVMDGGADLEMLVVCGAVVYSDREKKWEGVNGAFGGER